MSCWCVLGQDSHTATLVECTVNGYEMAKMCKLIPILLILSKCMWKWMTCSVKALWLVRQTSELCQLKPIYHWLTGLLCGDWSVHCWLAPCCQQLCIASRHLCFVLGLSALADGLKLQSEKVYDVTLVGLFFGVGERSNLYNNEGEREMS